MPRARWAGAVSSSSQSPKGHCDIIPDKAGKDYAPSPYLEVLKDHRDDFTVMSGLAHPQVAEGHDSGYSFLTGAHHSGFMRTGFRNTISLDQLAAEHIGGETRFPTLSLSTEGFGLSWTRGGVLVPSDLYPAAVFARLFVEGSPDQVAAQVQRLRQGPLRWHMIVTVAAPGDPVDDATKAWPADRRQVDVGTLTIDRAQAEENGACRNITFDPLILPAGMAASDDPLLPARSAVYSVSLTRRDGEPANPSAAAKNPEIRRGAP